MHWNFCQEKFSPDETNQITLLRHHPKNLTDWFYYDEFDDVIFDVGSDGNLSYQPMHFENRPSSQEFKDCNQYCYYQSKNCYRPH